jgi:L-asparaginase II
MPRKDATIARMTTLVPLIETYRGGTLENQHFGAVAVADTRGRLLAHAGDPHWLSFTRSTLKPFQALPLLQAGGPARFGFTRSQLALACASHSGEAMHVEQVQGMLDRIGLPVAALQCGCHLPMYVDAGVGPAPPAGSYDQRHHNCSGKHAGFLAWCVLHGQPTGNYLAPGHPLQQEVRRAVGRVMGLPAEDLRLGIDGCSAPNYAVPLSCLARAFARLASGGRDAEFGQPLEALSQAMVTHPELVSGTGRSDLALMRAGRGDWVTKVGADGVQAVGSASRGQAFALKVIDGNKTALFAATVAVLDQLGWLDARQKEELRPWRAEAIANARGTRVGERKAVLRLN